ncbi:MAG: C4-type zinc ribbon domain-containing protein [Acidimicrobiales bacterium]
MTTSPALLALLDVQAHDTRLDQLRHQLAHLPAREERDAAAAAVADAEAALAAESATRDDLARQQKRIDDEVESFKAKRQGFDQKLYGGTVSNPRELQDLQDEIDALGRRITQLEDEELEVMEQVEPVEAKVAELAATLDQRRAVLADAEARLTVAEAELAAEVDAEEAVRTEAAAPVPAELLGEYERLRAGRGGIGVAKLTGTQCGGCHLGLSAVEVAAFRKLPDGEYGHCEECGRILVP